MSEKVLQGLSAAEGIAVAAAFLLPDREPEPEGEGSEQERERALGALQAVAHQLGEAAVRLREMGLTEQAEILEASQLMATDPALQSEVARLALELPAGVALQQVTDKHAAALAGLDDPLLSARADDVREIGRRSVRYLSGAEALLAPAHPTILVAPDLGPAEIADLQLSGGSVRGIALARGSATSHAAILARSLGPPMLVGLGEAVLGATDGEMLVLDADRERLTLGASQATLQQAHAQERRRQQVQARLADSRDQPSITRDGHPIALLCNASSGLELRAGLQAGAQGVGLLRTEMAFLEFGDWPTEAQHEAVLRPLLASLAGRIATVRALDFGADKTPPFLSGIQERGLPLLLAHPASLSAQLRALLRAGAETQLRVLFPLVQQASQLQEARRLLQAAAEAAGWSGPLPAVGAMIETPGAVERADRIAAQADFLSIGTNDLVQYALGLDRRLPEGSARSAASSQVLRLVAEVVRVAQAHQRRVEVCGEAAGEPPVAALLVGLGVDELSVSPARLDRVRAALREVSFQAAKEVACKACQASSPEAALALGRSLLVQPTQ